MFGYIASATPDDIAVIERAGRRCSVCNTGRHWRRFDVSRADDRDPVVLCAACRTRFGDDPPSPGTPKPAPTAQSVSAPPPPPVPSEDRLRRALRDLPAGEHSTATIAKTAGLNRTKVLARLQALQDAGEVQQAGKHWSTGQPPTDLEAAFDRLQARTENLRIIRARERVS